MHATTVRGLTRLIVPAIVAIAAGALVAGCGDDEEKTAAAKPTPFAITATADGKKKALHFRPPSRRGS